MTPCCFGCFSTEAVPFATAPLRQHSYRSNGSRQQGHRPPLHLQPPARLQARLRHPPLQHPPADRGEGEEVEGDVKGRAAAGLRVVQGVPVSVAERRHSGGRVCGAHVTTQCSAGIPRDGASGPHDGQVLPYRTTESTDTATATATLCHAARGAKALVRHREVKWRWRSWAPHILTAHSEQAILSLPERGLPMSSVKGTVTRLYSGHF